MPINNERKLYKIGQLTRLLGITSRTLRYYDQTGILPHVKRSTGGMRLFDDEDLDIIRRVRKIQTEERLSLEAIRDRLYGSSLTTERAIVITDGGALIPDSLVTQLPLQIIPTQLQSGDTIFSPTTQSVEQFWEQCLANKQFPKLSGISVDTFVKAYTTCAEAGHTHIFSIHTSAHFGPIAENAKKAAALVAGKIAVSVYDSQSLGSGLGLLVSQIAEAVVRKEPLDQIRSFIAKQIPMAHLLCLSDGISHFTMGISGTSLSESNTLLLQKMIAFKPVFTIDNSKELLTIVDCCKTKAEAIDVMLLQLDNEVAARGKYLNRVMISYNGLESDAKKVTKAIKSQHPTVPIFVQKDSGLLSIIGGPKTLAISVA